MGAMLWKAGYIIRSADLVGSNAALQIQDIIRNTQNSGHGKLGGLMGTIILLIGASGVFSEIQSSINYLWSIPHT